MKQQEIKPETKQDAPLSAREEGRSSTPTIESYVQKALNRMQERLKANDKLVSVPVVERTEDYVNLTNSLISSFAVDAKEGAKTGGTEEVKEESSGQEERGDKTDSPKEVEFDFEQVSHTVSQGIRPLDEFNTARVESRQDTQLSYATVRPRANDVKSEQKLSALKKTMNGVRVQTIKTLAAAEKPSQSIINIMIAYVGLLQVTQHKECNLVKGVAKTYENCVNVLRNAEIVWQLTSELLNSVQDIGPELAEKIVKIKQKYLIGSDMRPCAISDKYQFAKSILNFLLSFINFIEVHFIFTPRFSQNTQRTKPVLNQLQRNLPHIRPSGS